jgi:hypothetical protein
LVKRVKPETASRILRTVSEKTFFFARNLSEYTGDAASSLTEFLDEVPNVPLESIEFHLYPRPPDFARWIKETLGDAYLATQTMKIDPSIKGEALRRTLHNIVEERLHELKVIALTGIKGIGVRYATQLVEAGIDSVEELAHYETHELAQQTNVSNRVAARWIQSAQQTVT